MRFRISLFVGVCLLLSSQRVFAQLDVFACEPEWASLATELGGQEVSVYQATTALQDPHRIEARPSLVARVRGADLVICTGAELEVGWLPVLLQTAGNRNVRAGTPGNLAASDLVAKLEVPGRLDRADGDIHPGGNPHIHLDPHNVAAVATALSARFVELDRGNATGYQQLGTDFQTRWSAAIVRWEQQRAALRGMRIIPHHKDHAYLVHWLGMVEVMNVEPKPGLPPSTAHLASLVERMSQDPVDAIVRSAYSDPKPAAWLAERTGAPVLMLPYTVGGTPEAKDLFGLFDDTLARLNGVRR